MPHLSSIRQLVQVNINAISGVSVICSVQMAVVDPLMSVKKNPTKSSPNDTTELKTMEKYKITTHI